MMKISKHKNENNTAYNVNLYKYKILDRSCNELPKQNKR